MGIQLVYSNADKKYSFTDINKDKKLEDLEHDECTCIIESIDNEIKNIDEGYYSILKISNNVATKVIRIVNKYGLVLLSNLTIQYVRDIEDIVNTLSSTYITEKRKQIKELNRFIKTGVAIVSTNVISLEISIESTTGGILISQYLSKYTETVIKLLKNRKSIKTIIQQDTKSIILARLDIVKLNKYYVVYRCFSGLKNPIIVNLETGELVTDKSTENRVLTKHSISSNL